MDEYDPNQAPDPSEWLELDEGTRIDLVLKHHGGDAKQAQPEKRLHAAFHVTVENQVALGEEPAPATIERLIREGLDRHDAVHAIGAILAEDIQALLSAGTGKFDVDRYRNRLDELTAKGWRKRDSEDKS